MVLTCCISGSCECLSTKITCKVALFIFPKAGHLSLVLLLTQLKCDMCVYSYATDILRARIRPNGTPKYEKWGSFDL